MNESLERLEALFVATLEKPPADRAAYLDQACADDPASRERVEALLRAQAAAGSFLEPPAPCPVVTVDEQPAGAGPGTAIGPYKLIEQIGEGGMGTVWMAQQTEPVRRLVAVKLIKAGMDSRQVIARFEAERQALALMDHPNIARVLDAGTTGAGRPYFIMDLVNGVPITRYCDEHHLTPRQRLELFIPVCQAVQHSHQKGIIHRDLKPSNVLVTLYDGQPVPKVIDFGVAKAAGQSLTEKTLVTGFSAIVGTLEYMSPEQAESNQLDIDTRSDIYSLGVLLYELLAGSPPFTRKELEKAGMLEMLRVIREQEPTKPSTRLSTAEGLPTLAANRGTEPAKLARLVRGELDWIVMKALEKDRNRRYETANGFAMDVQRYLADEPVQACPPSAGYRLRKFARRNKVGLTVAALVLFFLVLLGGGSGWAVRDREARRVRTANEVNQFLERAESLYADNKLPEAASEVEKARGVLGAGSGDEGLTRRVRQWVVDFDTATKLEELRLQLPDIANPDQLDAHYARLFRDYGVDAEALSVEAAATRIARSRIRFELVVALNTWAWSVKLHPRPREPARWEHLRAISQASDPDPWRRRLTSAAHAQDLQTLRAAAAEADLERMHPRNLAHLGTALTNSGDPDAGVAVLRKAQRHHPGDFLINEYLAECLARLTPPAWDEVVEFRRVVVALRPRSASAHRALGNALQQKGRMAEAIEAHREADQLPPGHPDQHERFGWSLQSQGKFPEMEAAFRAVVRLSPDHAAGHHGLGRALLRQKKYGEAIASLRNAIRLGSKDRWVHEALGWALVGQAEPAEAEAAFREVVRLNPDLVQGYFGLARALVDQEKFADAETASRDALRLDPTHPWASGLLRQALVGQGKVAEAKALGKTTGREAGNSEQ